MRYWVVVLMACGSTHAANGEKTPSVAVHPVADLCVTKGALADGAIEEPTVRAFAPGAGGDAAELQFTYRGDAQVTRALASGQVRRQVGLKLRAQDSCNVVYVMWRLDPTPKLDVSVKSNPGKRTHEECGADGYIKVKSSVKVGVPAFREGVAHALRAEIVDGELVAWIDGNMAWRGRLPAEAAALSGPAGMRSDNVRLEGLKLLAPHAASGATATACNRHEADD